MKTTLIVILVFLSCGALGKATKQEKGTHSEKWSYDLTLNVTRCFKKKDFKVGCDSYRDSGKKFSSLSISSSDGNGDKFEYGYGKMIEGNLCDEHLRRITALVKKAKQVCVTGVGEFKEKDKTIAKWEELETKFGRTEWNDAFSD